MDGCGGGATSGTAPARGAERYDVIGAAYARYRRPDPRVAAAIDAALGRAASVVDVGSGTGSYTPRRPRVVAVEPSATMLAQRPADAAPVVRAVAERLPFRDAAFDAALAVLTVHHWDDAGAGLHELRRVAPRQVVLTWDPAVSARFWLVRDYLPEIAAHDATLPTIDVVRRHLAVVEEIAVPVPADCRDGFCGAYWRRPERYLDVGVRSAISAFTACPPAAVAAAVERLRADLESGRWARRYASMLDLAALDLGYRIVVAGDR